MSENSGGGGVFFVLNFLQQKINQKRKEIFRRTGFELINYILDIYKCMLRQHVEHKINVEASPGEATVFVIFRNFSSQIN